MKLNRLSKQQEVHSIPRSVVIPPCGGATFDPRSDGREIMQQVYEQYSAYEAERQKLNSVSDMSVSESPTPEE